MPELLDRLRDAINVVAFRYLFLSTAERPLVGRRLSSGSFVPGDAFVEGESLWLDARVRGLIQAGARADIVVCRDRDVNAWVNTTPPEGSVIARVSLVGQVSPDPIRLVPHLPAGRFDVLLDLNRDGGFDPRELVQGTRGAGIVVHEDPATPGPYATRHDDLDLGRVTIPPRGTMLDPYDVDLVLTLIKPVDAPLGPFAILCHGNGYDRRHTRPLGELLASWGISAAVCEHVLYQSTQQRAVQVQALLERLPRSAAGAGLDPRRVVLLGHSAGGGGVTIVARDAEATHPFAGLVLLDAAYPGLEPLLATPLMGMVGTPFGFSLDAIPGQTPGSAAPDIVEVTSSAASLVVVEAARHRDFTYPNGDVTDTVAPITAADGGLERRRYVAGMAAAFCRRHLLGERSLDVFLVDGRGTIASVDARVAARPARRHRAQLEAGQPTTRIVHELGGGGRMLLERGLVVDCNLIDPGRAMWFRATRAGSFVRWPLPAPLPVAPVDLSLHVAQIADQPGRLPGSSATRAALDLGRVDVELASELARVGIELEGATTDLTGPATVITPGVRWTIDTAAGRTYTLTYDNVRLHCEDSFQPNLPARRIEIVVELVDRVGRRAHVELAVPPPTQVPGHLPVSTYTGFRLPLAAFDIDARELVSVAIIAREACELAIDRVELVTSWD